MNPFKIDQFVQDWADGVATEDLHLFDGAGFRFANELTPHQAAHVFPGVQFNIAIASGYHAVHQPNRKYLELVPTDRPRFNSAFCDFLAKETEALTKQAISVSVQILNQPGEYLPEVLEDKLRHNFAPAHKAFVDINMAIVNETLERYVSAEHAKADGYAVYLIMFMANTPNDGVAYHGGVRIDSYIGNEKQTWFFTEPK